LRANPDKPLLAIVNADDFGASQSINEAICRELEAGRVTSATLMANGPGFSEALNPVREFSACSFGVHLNLTEFPPLTSSPQLKRLLDSRGNLHPGLRYRLFGPRELCAVYREFAAQIRRVAQGGVRISHLDSHWHIHTRPDFLPLIKLLQREFGIGRVRARLNLYPLNRPPGLRNRIAIPLCNAALRSLPGGRTTDLMGPLAVFLERLASGRQPRGGSVELMVHPGLNAPEYLSETALLSTDWSRMSVRRIEHATFWDL
jgi:chitin disaccharide deacetylase